MAAHWNIKQLECWIWNFSSCYWTFSIALKHQLSVCSFSVSSHPRSHFSDKKHLWDCTTSQMPHISQYKANPIEMAIFLIQTIPEMHFARQFLQELPWWSRGTAWSREWEGRRERAEPFQLSLSTKASFICKDTWVYLNQTLFLHQKASKMIASCHSQLQWAPALPDERSLDYRHQADNKSQCCDSPSTLLFTHIAPAQYQLCPGIFKSLSP